MAVGHSDELDPDDAIRSVIAQCRVALGDAEPQAAILFSAFELFQPSMIAAVHDAFPGAHVIGCSASAELSSVEGYLEDSVALALLASDVVDFTVGLGSGLGSDPEGACQAAVTTALRGTTQVPRV